MVGSRACGSGGNDGVFRRSFERATVESVLLGGKGGSVGPLILVFMTDWPLIVSWRFSRDRIPVDVAKFMRM